MTPDRGALARALRGLIGPGAGPVGIGCADPAAPPPALWPDEVPATARMIDRRLREFAAGRAAARRAMAELGFPGAAIPMGSDRAPVWPAGLAGSIAHCATAAIAAVTPRDRMAGLGLDIEEATPLPPELWEIVLTPRERDRLTALPAPGRGLAAKQVFSAKEAAYKAQYPLTARMLDFQDVEIETAFSGGTETFSARIAGLPPARGALTLSPIIRTTRLQGLIISCSLLHDGAAGHI